MKAIKATSVSRRELRDLAFRIRKFLGLEQQLYFDIIRFLEMILPMIIDGFVLEIVEQAEMGGKEGETFPNQKLIRIREDVYEGVVAGDGRCRLTIAHEIAHLLLHKEDSIAFCRRGKSEKIEVYEDPEWQADALGGELLMPYNLIQNMSVLEIQKECRVSLSAAKCHYRLSRK